MKSPTKPALSATCFLLAVPVLVAAWSGTSARGAEQPRLKLGAYFFDGWSGQHRSDGDPAQPWAKGAPTNLTKSLAEDYRDREPLWGWRADTPELMRQQIDLAADHGLSFWAFDWYFNASAKVVADNPHHTGLNHFLAAPNNRRLQFCLLVANHGIFELKTLENWRKAAAYWLPYLQHPRHIQLAGKPLIIIFNVKDTLPEGMVAVDQAARAAGLPGVSFASCGLNLPEPFAASTCYNRNGGWLKGWEEKPYERLFEFHRQSWKGTPTRPHIPCLAVGFDRRPWETAEKGSHYYTGGTPELFAANLRAMITWMETNPEQVTAERLAMIFAWNEIGEGGYLIPTRGDPSGAYLKALKGVVRP